MADEKSSNHYLDATGLSCPEPVMLLHAAIRDAESGERVIVRATDPSTKRDFLKFCNYLGHVIDVEYSEGDVLIYEIIKNGAVDAT